MAPTALQDTVPTKPWHALEDGRVRCDLCPQACDAPLAVHVEARPGSWGARRKPVMLRKPVTLTPSA